VGGVVVCGSSARRVTGGRPPIEVTVAVGDNERGRSPVDATGDWSVRTTLPAADPDPVPTVGDDATATTGGGAKGRSESASGTETGTGEPTPSPPSLNGEPRACPTRSTVRSSRPATERFPT
jgi:hypothetical protein